MVSTMIEASANAPDRSFVTEPLLAALIGVLCRFLVKWLLEFRLPPVVRAFLAGKLLLH